MDEQALFTKFWTHETATTGKVIARIRKVRLSARPEVAHRAADRVAHLLRGEDDHRSAGDGEGGLGAAADARDDA